MEASITNSVPWNLSLHLGWRTTDKCFCLSYTPNPNKRKGVGIVCARLDRRNNLLKFRSDSSFLHKIPTPSEETNSKLQGIHCSTYVAEGCEASRPEENSGTRTIPGLPDENAGEAAALIASTYWEWKPKFNVHYESAGSENVTSPPVLFLPGFGVGSFHYEKQLKDLGRDYRVWALDFLGQGFSLPAENPTSTSGGENDANWGFGDTTEPWASELAFSMDLWRDQVHHFIQEVIGEPVYLVGNSLGGYVSLYLAATHPHLVRGVTLLNATPFWGFFPNPVRSPRLARIFPWLGAFPLPGSVKNITNILWQKISDPASIAEILKQVYADHSTNVDKVFSRIIEITQHPAAPASFASIMCSPQGQMSFKESLSICKASNVPICLVYGREDPWVRPIWGLKAKRQVPEAPYYEISPAGHCPHDEVPEVVNYLLRGWISNVESQKARALPLMEDEDDEQNDTMLKEVQFARGGAKKSVKVKVYANDFSLWCKVRSLFKAQLR